MRATSSRASAAGSRCRRASRAATCASVRKKTLPPTTNLDEPHECERGHHAAIDAAAAPQQHGGAERGEADQQEERSLQLLGGEVGGHARVKLRGGQLVDHGSIVLLVNVGTLVAARYCAPAAVGRRSR